MSNNFRVKPSKPTSLLAMIVGGLFVVFGLLFAIPNFGMFGVIWTVIAFGVTVFHAYNVFTERGVSTYDVDVESNSPDTDYDFDSRLRKLQALRDDGLITEEEYQRKRTDILEEDW